jgi:hypothetical protein
MIEFDRKGGEERSKDCRTCRSSKRVSILIASTTLLNNSGNLPSWWFSFSLIVLIALIFFMPIMIFAEPVREKIRDIRLRRKSARAVIVIVKDGMLIDKTVHVPSIVKPSIPDHKVKDDSQRERALSCQNDVLYPSRA